MSKPYKYPQSQPGKPDLPTVSHADDVRPRFITDGVIVGSNLDISCASVAAKLNAAEHGYRYLDKLQNSHNEWILIFERA